MNIYINGRFLTQSITGVQRYAQEIVTAFDTLIEQGIISNEYNFIILIPRGKYNYISLNNITIRSVGILKGHLWEQIELPLFVKKNLLINLCNVGPAFKKNQIVTIHDTSVFLNTNNYSILFKAWYKIVFKLEVKNSRKIITVSNFSLSQLVKYLNINKSNSKVIYEGNDHIKKIVADNRILIKNSLTEHRYLLSVSSLNPNKNFKGVIKSLRYVDGKKFDVVVAGGINPKVFNSRQTDLLGKVKYLGYVSDEELKSLYENAFCFIYPSFYEGFGIPPLEAMTLGCPVIVSNSSSLPEVCADAALYCDPSDPVDIADKVNMLINSSELQNELRIKGLKRSTEFSWIKCATEIYSTIIEELQS